jgi:hypothetical protein
MIEENFIDENEDNNDVQLEDDVENLDNNEDDDDQNVMIDAEIEED